MIADQIKSEPFWHVEMHSGRARVNGSLDNHCDICPLPRHQNCTLPCSTERDKIKDGVTVTLRALLFVALLLGASPAFATVIPAPAEDAGYTTLAFQSDFTSSEYANVATWLDCAGAANPQWYMTSSFGAPIAPCARASMVIDQGVRVLDLQFTAADQVYAATSISTTNTRDRGIDFPNGAYWSATVRTTPETINSNPYGGGAFAWWGWPTTAGNGASPSWGEIDWYEGFANGGDGIGYGYDDSCIHVFNDPSTTGVCFDGWGDYYQIDQTAWHTIGGLVTQSGATMSMCVYIDDVLRKCGSTPATDSELEERIFPILQVGLIWDEPVGATQHLLVKDVEIWTCPNWSGPLGVPGNAC
jgi:hypothetical protein